VVWCGFAHVTLCCHCLKSVQCHETFIYCNANQRLSNCAPADWGQIILEGSCQRDMVCRTVLLSALLPFLLPNFLCHLNFVFCQAQTDSSVARKFLLPVYSREQKRRNVQICDCLLRQAVLGKIIQAACFSSLLVLLFGGMHYTVSCGYYFIVQLLRP